MGRFARIAGRVLLALVALVAAIVVWMFASSNKLYHKHWTTAHTASFPIPFPSPGDSVADSAATAAAIAHGEQLIATRTPCSDCHGKDFGGGVVIGKSAVERALVGHWVAPNLTLGIGNVTAGFSAHDWDLAVRHGIRHDGQTSSMPCTEFQDLSDHELSDIVSAIRARPPVDRDLGKTSLGLMFAVMLSTDPKALAAYDIDHQKPHAVEAPGPENPVALGRHIAYSCVGCHGPNFSGGKIVGDPSMPIVANLTPDSSGVKGWSEADFLRAMHEGVRPDGRKLDDHMPWRVYGKMSEPELAAVWTFLQTLPPTPKGKRT